jgi:hypothetical protein
MGGAMSESVPKDCGRLLGEIQERIRSAQYEALRKVNKDLISLYCDIWELIPGRQSYHTFAGNEKLAPMVREIGWMHNFIMENCKDGLEREFYLRKIRK